METKYFIALLVFFSGVASASILIPTTHKYLTFKTTLNEVQNISWAFSKKKGLTAADKQAIVDMTNALRNKLAKGEQKKSWGGPMPTASNMLAVEWEDDFAEFAQKHANKCPKDHSDLSKIKSKNYKDANFGENLSGEAMEVDRDMYGEVKNFDYKKQSCKPGEQCGHYVTLASWANFRIGCGYIICKQGIYDKYMLVCVFGVLNTGMFHVSGRPREFHEHEYWEGKPCSECPQGWDYCLEGGLCATKKQCASDSNNKCVCNHDAAKCKSNGGTFDAANCRCKCPKNKFGTNCAKSCVNPSHLIYCGETCGKSQQALFQCPVSCKACGKDLSPAYEYWMEKRPAHNKDNIKVRGIAPTANVSPNVKTSTLPNRGSCKNRETDYFCEELRARNYCKGAFDGARWRYFCASSCNSCNDKEYAKKLEGGSAGKDTDSGWVTKAPDWAKGLVSGSTGDWSNLISGLTSGGWAPASGGGSTGGWTPASSSGSSSDSSGWAPWSPSAGKK